MTIIEINVQKLSKKLKKQDSGRLFPEAEIYGNIASTSLR